MKRETQNSYRGSVLGVFWLVLVPLFRLSIYSFVFGFVFRSRFSAQGEESPIEFVLGLFLGLTVFQFIADGITASPKIILQNSNLVKKIVFPLEILPLIGAVTGGIGFLIGNALIFLAITAFGIGFSATLLWYPLILIPIGLFTLGMYWSFSALGVYVRDLAQVTQLLSMLLLFSSAVFFPLSSVPEAAQKFLFFNPIVHAIEQSRRVVLWDMNPELGSLTYLYVVSFALFFFGYLVFKKLQPGFADVI